MTVELKEGGYQKLEQGIQKIESLAFDGLHLSQNMRDMVLGFLKVTQEVRKLQQTLRDTVLMVPDPHPATTDDKKAAA